MAEQPVNLSTFLYLGVFSRAEQRVLHAIFKAIAEGNGRCVATLARLARDSKTSKSTTRNAITQAVAIGLLKKTERRSDYAISLPNILSYGQALSSARDLMTIQKEHRLTSRTEDLAPLTNHAIPLFGTQRPRQGTGLGGLRP
jgi:DNA-binding IclR family transcriptional regulator